MEDTIGIDISKDTLDAYWLSSREHRQFCNDKASAMLMKRLRTVIPDKKITTHSLRHRMKDKLRNSGCPENLSMEILGHAQGSVAANYGSGYAIGVMREALVNVWRE
jgi:integrase